MNNDQFWRYCGKYSKFTLSHYFENISWKQSFIYQKKLLKSRFNEKKSCWDEREFFVCHKIPWN